MFANDNLPKYKELADILKTEEITDEEFVKLWEQNKSLLDAMWGSVSVLEGMAFFDTDFVLENRFFLGDIFDLAEEMRYVLQNDLFSDDEKECIFNKAFEEVFFQSLDEETIKIIRSIFDVEEKHLEINRYGKVYYSFEAILQKFKILLEHENMLWVNYLKRAGELKPHDKEVVTYLLDYAVITENDALIKEYQHRLEMICA